MMYWLWVALLIIAQAAALLTGTVGHGLLSRPIARLCGWHTEEYRTFGALLCRLLLGWCLVTLYVHMPAVPCGVLALLYIDDILAGSDGDNWRRRWQAARNRVRWLMVLPRRAPA